MGATVLLIRHATPDWARTDLRYDIPPGPPLTEQGEDEAHMLGQYLREQGVRKIYASPLDRTKRTAEVAAAVSGASVSEEPAIGEWRQGEREADVFDRCQAVWERACAESHAEGTVALITHGGPLRLLLQHLGVAQSQVDFYRKQFDRDNPVPPAGVWRFTIEGTDQWFGDLAFTPQPHKHYAVEAA